MIRGDTDFSEVNFFAKLLKRILKTTNGFFSLCIRCWQNVSLFVLDLVNVFEGWQSTLHPATVMFQPFHLLRQSEYFCKNVPCDWCITVYQTKVRFKFDLTVSCKVNFNSPELIAFLNCFCSECCVGKDEILVLMLTATFLWHQWITILPRSQSTFIYTNNIYIVVISLWKCVLCFKVILICYAFTVTAYLAKIVMGNIYGWKQYLENK